MVIGVIACVLVTSLLPSFFFLFVFKTKWVFLGGGVVWGLCGVSLYFKKRSLFFLSYQTSHFWAIYERGDIFFSLSVSYLSQAFTACCVSHGDLTELHCQPAIIRCFPYLPRDCHHAFHFHNSPQKNAKTPPRTHNHSTHPQQPPTPPPHTHARNSSPKRQVTQNERMGGVA